jgi:DnaJ-class molecular chaperone
MRRSSDGVNVYRYNEIHDLRVPPRTCTGDVLTVERMGDAGGTSGRYGDLICKIQVIDDPAPSKDPQPRAPAAEAPPDLSASGTTQIIEISIPEAVLGGRVEVPTPKGAVRLTVPPGSSSGTRLRLKGRGPNGGDIFVVLRIVVPRTLDEESRALMERFAALNPSDPRDDG